MNDYFYSTTNNISRKDDSMNTETVSGNFFAPIRRFAEMSQSLFRVNQLNVTGKESLCCK